ncbi:MAG: DUF362 domain-containing protein [Tannerella sp.]|jgi:uncharacterized protein (DUF362 family)|nr:DUF362 domain-containing protein [Tannerella sp.]
MIKLRRRDFIRTSLFGGIAAATMPASVLASWGEETKVAVDTNAKVSLVTGKNRAEMAFNALQPFAKEIAQAVGNRRIVVKPNMVEINIPLCATHKDTIEGILEFYKSINKLENVVIGESVAFGQAMPSYDYYGYIPLAEKYKVKLLDLDEHPFRIHYVTNELDAQPKPIRVSALLADRDNYVMSVARMKTHNNVVVTLSLKNVVLGSPIKDPGYTSHLAPNATSGKWFMHGNGYRAINYNMYSLAYRVRPDLAFIDGYEGMEGHGPTEGTPVDHRVCVAGLDWMAVDRVGIELMGVDPTIIGYLKYCSEAGMGQFDLSKIDILGEKLADHIKSYKLAPNIDKQLQWMTPINRNQKS